MVSIVRYGDHYILPYVQQYVSPKIPGHTTFLTDIEKSPELSHRPCWSM